MELDKNMEVVLRAVNSAALENCTLEYEIRLETYKYLNHISIEEFDSALHALEAMDLIEMVAIHDMWGNEYRVTNKGYAVLRILRQQHP
jgi:hypothetical protein